MDNHPKIFIMVFIGKAILPPLAEGGVPMDIKLNQAKDTLTIVLPYNSTDAAPVSSSGKSLLRASTGGNQAVAVDGRQIKVGVNVFETIPTS